MNDKYVFEFKAIIFVKNDKDCAGCHIKCIKEMIDDQKGYKLGKIVSRKIEGDNKEIIKKLIK